MQESPPIIFYEALFIDTQNKFGKETKLLTLTRLGLSSSTESVGIVGCGGKPKN